MLKEQINQTAGLVGFADIAKEPIKGWREYLEDGKGFLATAEKAHSHRRTVFTPEILYNLVAMGIEKLIMAMLMKSGNLPYNHTMGDLVHAMEEFLPGKLGSLGAELQALDAFQEICDPEEYTIKSPTMAEVQQMLALGQALKNQALAYIGH